ncbi:alcohol dehydrogenase catalytic domain-containing protein [Streptomyces sp. NPDC059515]|uniref:alcohol dehydrogenase catalytic domain-containing protein n=1 Tax=Streptomyces sp. NPDC059515 TaxID=3346854 RepID=UPI00367D22CA
MRAWQFNEVNEPFTLVEREDPKPGADEIVIDVKASGLCHSDVSFVDGTLTPLLGYRPIILGHETAGVVSAVGADVTAFAVGGGGGGAGGGRGPGGSGSCARLINHVPPWRRGRGQHAGGAGRPDRLPTRRMVRTNMPSLTRPHQEGRGG